MRVAALYDVHGNLPALEAVLWELHVPTLYSHTYRGSSTGFGIRRHTISVLPT